MKTNHAWANFSYQRIWRKAWDKHLLPRPIWATFELVTFLTEAKTLNKLFKESFHFLTFILIAAEISWKDKL